LQQGAGLPGFVSVRIRRWVPGQASAPNQWDGRPATWHADCIWPPNSIRSPKYDTRASQKWVTGFAEPERLRATLELVPD
jgi:hypothetical protein